MVALSADECRVLGVLVEKAQTTPAQYPMTLNAIVAGSNQRNNRDPVTDLDEPRVYDALDSLRAKGLVNELMLAGSRVSKFRHLAREVLGVSTTELVILTELLLRGPQTVGELRTRASRMFQVESLETAQAALASLISRPAPLVRELAPAPGTRAPRYAQLLCPALHPLDEAAGVARHLAENPATPHADARADPDLLLRVAALEHEVATLRAEVRRLADLRDG